MPRRSATRRRTTFGGAPAGDGNLPGEGSLFGFSSRLRGWAAHPRARVVRTHAREVVADELSRSPLTRDARAHPRAARASPPSSERRRISSALGIGISPRARIVRSRSDRAPSARDGTDVVRRGDHRHGSRASPGTRGPRAASSRARRARRGARTRRRGDPRGRPSPPRARRQRGRSRTRRADPRPSRRAMLRLLR